jgi:hypothetical protein
MNKDYTISSVDDKSPDWKILTLEIVEGEGSVMFEDVSVNRVNKKGEAFPNFDNLKVGERVKGNLWTSSAGKKYLFAPDLNKPAGGANRGQSGGFKAGMQKMVEQKQAGIEKNIDRKEEGIKISSTMRDAVQIALAELGGNADHEDYERRIQYWRQWLWGEWENVNDFPPFR